jgi:hypothetical protein
LKAGATAREPDLEISNFSYYRLNIDKSNQSHGGSEMGLLGNVAKKMDGTPDYVMLERKSQTTLTVDSDEYGNIWLIFGTDSGHEGYNALY